MSSDNILSPLVSCFIQESKPSCAKSQIRDKFTTLKCLQDGVTMTTDKTVKSRDYQWKSSEQSLSSSTITARPTPIINSSRDPKFQQSFQHVQVSSENGAFVKGECNFKIRLQWWLKTKAEGAMVKDPCHGLITIIRMEIKGIIVFPENCSISASWDSLSPACSLLILKKKKYPL